MEIEGRKSSGFILENIFQGIQKIIRTKKNNKNLGKTKSVYEKVIC